MTQDVLSENITKLLIDDSSDFGFHAAYLAYDKAWTENVDEKVRLELNKIMLSLTENQEDYSDFYQEINKFREDSSNKYSNRGRFKAQKKRAWRKSLAKKANVSRHKNRKRK